MMFPKDIAETIEVVFDFAPLIADLGLDDLTLDSPVIEVARDSGDEALIAVGSPIISGLTVTQFYSGGTRSVTYDLACTSRLSNGERRRLVDFLTII